MTDTPLSEAVLAALRELDTPTICNAIEVLTPERQGFGFTSDPLFCARPELPPMVGYARTATIRSREKPAMPADEVKAIRLGYYDYVDNGPKPSIIIIQDLEDEPGYGSFWGEVQSNVHKGLGALGVVTSGSVRDIDACAEGFQFMAAKVVPSHAYVHAVSYGGEVSIAGMTVKSGDLVHADRHGAVVVPADIAADIPATAEMIGRREAVIIGAAQKPGYGFDQLKEALQTAAEIH